MPVVKQLNQQWEIKMERIGDEMTSEQLVKDFKVLVADAEALLTETANRGGRKTR